MIKYVVAIVMCVWVLHTTSQSGRKRLRRLWDKTVDIAKHYGAQTQNVTARLLRAVALRAVELTLANLIRANACEGDSGCRRRHEVQPQIVWTHPTSL